MADTRESGDFLAAPQDGGANFEIARQLFTPIPAIMRANESAMSAIEGSSPLSVSSAKGVSTGLWNADEVAAAGGGQSFASVRTAVDLTPPA